MESEALNTIIDLVKSNEPIIEAPDFGLTGAYFTRTPDGDLLPHNAAIRPQQAHLRSTESLIDLVGEESGDGEARIYYSDSLITAAIQNDTTGVRWQHVLRLPKHPAFAAVEQLTNTRTFAQRDLIKFLRATLNGHVDDHIVEEFRALKVATDGENNSIVAKGREAIDKRIQQKILQETGSAIPDQITVTVPVYDLDETRADLYDVEVLVDTTTNEAGAVVFELTTVLNSLRTAQSDALDIIVANIRRHLERLTATDIPLYYGAV